MKLISALLVLSGFIALFFSIGFMTESLPMMALTAVLAIISFVSGWKLLQRDRIGWIMTLIIFIASFIFDIWLMTQGEIPIVRMIFTLIVIMYLQVTRDIFFEE